MNYILLEPFLNKEFKEEDLLEQVRDSITKCIQNLQCLTIFMLKSNFVKHKILKKLLTMNTLKTDDSYIFTPEFKESLCSQFFPELQSRREKFIKIDSYLSLNFKLIYICEDEQELSNIESDLFT